MNLYRDDVVFLIFLYQVRELLKALQLPSNSDFKAMDIPH
jgi:hypothetical protein